MVRVNIRVSSWGNLCNQWGPNKYNKAGVCARRYEYKSVVIDPGCQDSAPCWFSFQWSNHGLFYTWDDLRSRRKKSAGLTAKIPKKQIRCVCRCVPCLCVVFTLAEDTSSWQHLSVRKYKHNPPAVPLSEFFELFMFTLLTRKPKDSSVRVGCKSPPGYVAFGDRDLLG